MCYDAEYHARRQLKDAMYQGASDEVIQGLWKRLIEIERIKRGIDAYQKEYEEGVDVEADVSTGEREPGSYWHIKGFSHPTAIICTDIKKPSYEIAEWGFIGHWVETEHDAYDWAKRSNNNLNAVSETMFKSRAFPQAARERRCVIRLEAYYEHHQQQLPGRKTVKKYPFRITHAEGKPLYMAGVYNNNVLLDESTGETIRKKSFAIVTCLANSMLTKIHNNPDSIDRNGARMLVILDVSQLEQWLQPYPGDEADPAEIKALEQSILELCKPYDEELLSYQTVGVLSGKSYIGNVPAIRDQVMYEKMDYDQVFN